MADQFYTHRLRKVLEDMVLTGGMTVHISDESSTVKLKDHIAAIQTVATSVGVDCSQQPRDGVTIVSFRAKK